MTVIPELAGIPWQRKTLHVSDPAWPWWIPDEAPGGLGSPELWMDEAALDMYGQGDAAPAVTVRPEPGRQQAAVSWIGAIVLFSTHPGPEYPVLYVVESRQTSPANASRPYYVLKRPD